MRILLWHVHGSWTNAFVQGGHTYLLPRLPGGGPWGLGRARTWDWPSSVVEVGPAEAATADVDVVVLQRPEELHGLAGTWLGGRRPGADVPAVYLEHNAPQGRVSELRHPAADRPELRIVHVTHFNALFWDTGATPTTVIDHGIVDPGERYTGELDRAAVVVNEPVRRGRVTGTDLLPRFAEAAAIDLFGMKVAALDGRHGIRAFEDLTQARLHEELGRRRVYVHPFRWTSLGLSLLEAMHLGMPVVALATTEDVEAVPPGCGVVSTCVDRLVGAVRELRAEPERAQLMGAAGRRHALERYGLKRFLDEWDRLLWEVTA
jgi:glycosyltransferase involved in cell wall biosynthesis